jgi:methionyl-tRNA synthetase
MMIKIDDFRKVELKIGKIVEVKDHPNADKLYVVMVDLGDAQKQLVAGIKNSYTDKDTLVGKQVVVVANLEPAILRGVESQGMILAASDDAGISVVTTDKPVKIGSIVK